MIACAAPGAPSGCEGDVTGVLCAAHRQAWTDLTGPWRTRSGAEEWLRAVSAVMSAGALPSPVPLEEPSAGQKPKPWVDWSKPGAKEKANAHGFPWVGGHGPMWDTDDGRTRHFDIEDNMRKQEAKAGRKRRPWWGRKKAAG